MSKIRGSRIMYLSMYMLFFHLGSDMLVSPHTSFMGELDSKMLCSF